MLWAIEGAWQLGCISQVFAFGVRLAGAALN